MRPLLFLLLLATLLATVGCSSAPARKPVEEVAVGAEHWASDALLLPTQSPLVAELHLLELFTNLSALRSWWSQEPEMFGPEGTRTGELANLYWGILSTYTGGDPSSPQTWREMGIDASRPLRIGMYNAGAEGASILRAVANELPTSTTAKGEVRAGLFTDVRDATSTVHPVQGTRWLIPIFDSVALNSFVRDLAETVGYRALSTQERAESPLATDVTAYFIDDPAYPLLATRMVGNTLVIDLVYQDGKRSAATAQATLARAVSVPSGRPLAARPPGSFVFGVGMNQSAMADVVMIRGIFQALDVAQSLDALRRDDAFATEMRAASARANAWLERAEELPGLAYAVSGASESGVGRNTLLSLEMTLFLGRSQPSLKTSTIQRGIQVEEQGVGLRADFRPLFDPAWKSLLSHQDPDAALEAMDAGDDDALFFALGFPRSLALLVGNLADAGPEGFSEQWSPLVAAIPALARIDVAVSDVTESAPAGKVIFYGALKPELKGDQMQEAARNLAMFVDQRVSQLKGSNPSLQMGAFEPEVATPLPIADAMGAVLFSPSRHEVLIGVDMEVQELVRFNEKLSNVVNSSKDIFYLRLEPATFFIWMQWLNAGTFGRVDTGRLAQRLGPIEVQVTPDSHDGTQMLRWRVKWMAVPSLE